MFCPAVKHVAKQVYNRSMQTQDKGPGSLPKHTAEARSSTMQKETKQQRKSEKCSPSGASVKCHPAARAAAPTPRIAGTVFPAEQVLFRRLF